MRHHDNINLHRLGDGQFFDSDKQQKMNVNPDNTDIAACNSAQTKPAPIAIKTQRSIGVDRLRQDLGSLEARKRFRMMVESYRPMYRTKSMDKHAEVLLLHSIASDCAKRLMDEVSHELAQETDAFDYDSSPVKSRQARRSRSMGQYPGSPYSSFSTVTHQSFAFRPVLTPRTFPDWLLRRVSGVTCNDGMSPSLSMGNSTFQWSSSPFSILTQKPSFHMNTDVQAPAVAIREHADSSARINEEQAANRRGFLGQDVGTAVAGRDTCASPSGTVIGTSKLHLSPRPGYASSPMYALTTTSKQSSAGVGQRSVLIGKIGSGVKDLSVCDTDENEDPPLMFSPVERANTMVREYRGAHQGSGTDGIDTEHMKSGWQTMKGLTLPLLSMPSSRSLDPTPSSFLTRTTELVKALPTTRQFYRPESESGTTIPPTIVFPPNSEAASTSIVSSLLRAGSIGSMLSCGDVSPATETKLSTTNSFNIGRVSHGGVCRTSKNSYRGSEVDGQSSLGEIGRDVSSIAGSHLSPASKK
eukprot:GEMP01021277.1.p1 GENE.GEMP01021277.1~~GEMP01021277.1.p1  ORF type:complete len:527 (+),score=90.61 GEMP01021277.1:252-1832(+)